LYRDHLLRLHRQCRRSRFGNEVSDHFLQDYVGRIDLTNTAILGYFDGDEMRAGAELRSMGDIGAMKRRPPSPLKPNGVREGLAAR
jgi:hypothetical protein